MCQLEEEQRRELSCVSSYVGFNLQGVARLPDRSEAAQHVKNKIAHVGEAGAREKLNRSRRWFLVQ